MENGNDQLLEPKDKGERTVKVRVSREGGLEELVRELYLKSKFVLRAPVEIRLDEDDKELTFSFSMNIGTEPHPGLHYCISFDVPIKLPARPVEVDDWTPKVKSASHLEQLKAEVTKLGGNPDDIITPGMTEEKAKEVLDALQSTGA